MGSRRTSRTGPETEKGNTTGRCNNAVRERMNERGLELHPGKTQLVYSKDYRRRDNYPVVKFYFPGYSFQPRTTKRKKTGKLFLRYGCAISISSKKRIADRLEDGHCGINPFCVWYKHVRFMGM